MPLPEQLTAMIFELRSVGSPVARARALARAWRFIRRLSPQDRRLLAEEAGFEGAEELVDALALKKGGVAPAMLLQLLGKLRDQSEDGGLSTLITSLREPGKLDEALARGIDAVTEALEPNLAGESEAEEAFEEAVFPPMPEVEPEPSPRPEPEPEPSPRPRPRPSPRLSQNPNPEPSPMPMPMPMPNPNPIPRPSPMPEPEPEPEPETTSEPEPEPRSAISPLVAELKHQPSLLARLLTFRDALPRLGGIGRAGLVELVGAFPDGWARRRAVMALIEADVPASTGAAIAAVEALDRPSDRDWCYGLLAGRSDLDRDQRDLLTERVSSPTLRRRLLRSDD